jgi:hypothetical protein
MPEESKNTPASEALKKADAGAPALRADTAPRKSGETVWVQCKLPHGLQIHLHREGLSADGRPKPIHVPIPESRMKLNGANSSRVIGASGRNLGYGLTEVPKDYWDRWMDETGKTFPAVQNGMILVQPTRDRAMGSAMEHASLRTGFERLDPDKPGGGVTQEEGAAKASASALTVSMGPGEETRINR